MALFSPICGGGGFDSFCVKQPETPCTLASRVCFIVVEVFDNDREHLKQELLVPDDEFSTIQTTSFIKMPTSVLKAW